jgi:capsular polysaccharide transport system permease protein
MSDAGKPPDMRAPNALERAEAVSRILSEAARRARFSTRVRGAYQRTSLSTRRGGWAMRVAVIALFVALVAIPNLVAMTYFGLLASDQYVSEAKFTVSSGAMPKLDGVGSIDGASGSMIAQNISIVVSYIESRALVEELERNLNLRDLYGADSIDWWARFDKSKSIEKFTTYWWKMAETKIASPAGIVTLKVRAFAPADAKAIADAVMSSCEKLVNSLNERMRRDTIRASQIDVERAGERLKIAWVALEKGRNAEGLIDVALEGKAMSEVISKLETDRLAARQEYEIQGRYLDQTSPQLRVIRRRIDALDEQIAKLRADITTKGARSVEAIAEQTLSGKMTKFAKLDLEHKIAETSYSAATTALESARMLSERQLLYLHRIAAPAMPEEALYPRRWLYVGVILAGSFALWGIVVGLIVFVRNHMA